MKAFGIRARLALLVVFAALPALGLFVYETIEQRRSAEDTAEAGLMSLTRLAARQQAEVVQGARLMLAAVAHTVPALRNDPARCNQFFARMLEQSRGTYHSMGLYDASGVLKCNALPWEGKVMALDRLYFVSARDSHQFSVGEYQMGRITRQQGINFAYPVTEGERVIDVAFAALDLASFNRMAAATPLPNGGVLSVVDHSGTVLARHPETASVVGQKLRNPAVLAAVHTGASALFRANGTDGSERLYSTETVVRNAAGQPGISLVISIPVDVIYAEGSRVLRRNLAGLAAATLLVLLLGWYGAERYVFRRLRKLLGAVSRMQGGDLTARTGLKESGDELSHLGHAFDSMAQALQERDFDQKQTLTEVQQEAITDALTGLPNRRYLDEFLPRELLRAQRTGTMVATFMLDVDHFKRFNDTFGHEAGDLVLRELGRVLRGQIRGSDVACRYGGEEFTVALLDVTPNGAARKAEEIRAAIAGLHLSHEGRPLGKISASLGVALFPRHASNPGGLLKAADEAMYGAKGAGRNCVLMAEDPLEKAA